MLSGAVATSGAADQFSDSGVTKTIGAKRFHFRVRDGIGLYLLAIVAGRTS